MNKKPITLLRSFMYALEANEHTEDEIENVFVLPEARSYRNDSVQESKGKMSWDVFKKAAVRIKAYPMGYREPEHRYIDGPLEDAQMREIYITGAGFWYHLKMGGYFDNLYWEYYETPISPMEEIADEDEALELLMGSYFSGALDNKWYACGMTMQKYKEHLLLGADMDPEAFLQAQEFAIPLEQRILEDEFNETKDLSDDP